MSPTQRIDELRLAFMLLTRLPVGRLGEGAPMLGAAQWAFPLVGLVTGLTGWGVHAAALAAGLGPSLAAIFAVGALVLVTGALHLDGLADFADGLGGGPNRERRLEIMRDSRIGSYGVLALIFALVSQVAALSQLGSEMSFFMFLLAATASRLAMVVCLVALPPARTDGLGHAAVAGAGGSWIVGAVITLALALILGWTGLAAVLLGGLATAFVATLARRGLGGHTGDVLGAVQVASETACWIAFVALLTG